MMLRNLVDALNDFLNNPRRVLIVCLVFVLVALLFDGTLIKIWKLNQDIAKLENNIIDVGQANRNVRMQISQANDPQFIEREARDRFDLVEENDLVFVFSAE